LNPFGIIKIFLNFNPAF